MTTPAYIPELRRVRFEHGQSLSASDLTEMQDSITELRWLQNRMFHGWGIVSGLSVQGVPGESQLTVSAGFALDCFGREILLTSEQVVSIPRTGASDRRLTFYLVVSYRDDDKQQVLEKRASACLPGGTVRLSNEADLGWRLQHRVRRGLDIVLARIIVRRCSIVERVDLSVRRYVPVCGGRSVASGHAGRFLNWRALAGLAGVSAYIDTRSAAFERTPVYRAEVLGQRTMSDGRVLVVPITQISEPTPTGFTLDIRFPLLGRRGVNPRSVRNNPVDTVRQLGWQVDWLGVEQ